MTGRELFHKICGKVVENPRREKPNNGQYFKIRRFAQEFVTNLLFN